MTDERVGELIKECRRQEESCKYTAAGLYIWQKSAQCWKNVFIVAPIVLGGFATSQFLAENSNEETWRGLAAVGAALLAGFFPAIYESLGMNMRVREIGTAASEFTNLRDRFRQLASLGAHMEFEELNAAFEQVMDRMDAARTTSPPLPESFFKKGQHKINKGHYDFEVDKET